MEDIYVGKYLVKGDRYYTKDHEWAYIRNGKAQIGITDYAQKLLGDIVYIDLPQEGQTVDAGDTIANIESVKNVAPVYSPLTGTVAEVNNQLADEPTLINEDPYDAGWIAILDLSDPTEVEDLMTAEDYAELLAEIIKEEEEQEVEIETEEIEESIENIPEKELGYEEEK